MNVDMIRTLYEYNYRAHDVVWRCVCELSEEKYMQPLDYSVGSIHNQVTHMMAAEHIWFSRLRGDSPKQLLTGEDFASREEVEAKWLQVKKGVLDYLAGLNEELLGKMLHYHTSDGQPHATPILGVLVHVANHATDHRAQTLAMIHMLGGRTAPQDLIYFYRKQL